MKELFILLVHLLTTRARRRAPSLSALNRFLFGFWSLFLNPRRLRRAAVILRPSTLLRFHHLLKQRKYRRLYATGRKGKPGPKGPSPELIQAIIALKQRNPRFGCRRIVQQIAKTFGVKLDKDTVRRVLAAHYRPDSDGGGPSWLTFIGHTKDSLWSMDLFRCESIVLKTHGVLVVMDQWSQRIIGFGVCAGDVDGIALCRMFNTAIASQGIPHYLSADNDPLFRYHQWRANLRILEIEEIKSIPYTPQSHPFIERLIGTIRREYLDHTLFWNAQDLERKLTHFKRYYNQNRTHQSLDGDTPAGRMGETQSPWAELWGYSWQSHCGGLVSDACFGLK